MKEVALLLLAKKAQLYSLDERPRNLTPVLETAPVLKCFVLQFLF
jgi:hypothetical protein